MNVLILFIGLSMNNEITKIENISGAKDLLWRRNDAYTDLVPLFLDFLGNLLVKKGVRFEFVKDGRKIRLLLYLFLDDDEAYQTIIINARDVIQGEFLDFFKRLYKVLGSADSKNNKTLQRIEDY